MRRLLALALLPLFASIPGCAADADGLDDEAQVTDEELAAETESFAPLDATDDELARAKPAGARFEHEVTVFAIPAPKLTGLSWGSPGALARRTLINEGAGFSRAIGHAAIRIDCGATPTRAAAHFQGSMVNVGDEFRSMVLGEKAGLGVLFRTVPGAIETEQELQSTLDSRYGEDGRVTFMRIGVRAETCHALLDYERAYDKRNVEEHYGFVRPSFGEGAGCSAFSMSFLKLANLVEPFMNTEWKFDVRVPMTLIGGETNPGNKVGVARLLVLGRPWAAPSEPHIRLNGWDPTLMFKSIRLRAIAGLLDHSTVVERRGRALGIVVDRRAVAPTDALLRGDYWKGPPSTKDRARFLTADY